jgi:hypothetical protein
VSDEVNAATFYAVLMHMEKAPELVWDFVKGDVDVKGLAEVLLPPAGIDIREWRQWEDELRVAAMMYVENNLGGLDA